jgi:PII-like signaling protein
VTEDCLKLTTYSGERHRVAGALVADELLALYGRRGLETSILLRGIEGFGSHQRLHTDRLLSLSEDLPIVSVAVDTSARITDTLQELLHTGRHGLVTLERARMLRRGSSAIELPDALGSEVKLTIYLQRRQRIAGRAAFLAVCELLAARGIAGATVFLGVDGTVRGARRRARFMATNAGVPMMIVAVGRREPVAAILPELARMAPESLLTLERVQVCKREGTLLASPPATSGGDPSGLPVWQKLMVYSSEQARHAGSPLHVSLVRALARGGVRGATCLRGIWGFHGDHAPHGDRLLALRRRVPVVTIVVDAPERIATAFALIDAHTERTGLVTCELVPTAVAIDAGRAHGQLTLPGPVP